MNPIEPIEPIKQFRAAEKLMSENNLEDAAKLFLKLEKVKELTPFCHYHMARISNITGAPEAAYEYYYKAFTAMPDITSKLFPKEHSSFNYVFRGKKDEKENTSCPLCGRQGEPRWCYPLAEAAGFKDIFNPVRMWMYCEPCHHMFARDFPEKLFLFNDSPRRANPAFFPYYSRILSKMRAQGYAAGMSLFEIGIGACECLLAAREIGYETFGIDVIPRHVEDAKNKYGLNAAAADFNEFQPDRKWDVIMMGDVLEHVSDPIQAIAKTEAMLKDDGALWISTPTFESAFSVVVGHDDPMRRQQFHLNYFSRASLYLLLAHSHLLPVDYHISEHYNGSMEVIAIKEARLAQ